MAGQNQKQGEGFKKTSGGGGGDGPEGGGQTAREKAANAVEKANEQVFTNHVVYGANDVELQLEGHTVAQIEEALAEVLNLDAGAEAYIDGKLVEDKSRFKIKAGQRLEFMKESGQKGKI